MYQFFPDLVTVALGAEIFDLHQSTAWPRIQGKVAFYAHGAQLGRMQLFQVGKQFFHIAYHLK